MNALALPENKPVKDLLQALLARPVSVAPGPAVQPSDEPPPTTAAYVDDRNRLSSVVLMDLPLTAYVGAALGLVPKAGADGQIVDGGIDADLQENTSEVLNVMSALLADAAGHHQRLYRAYFRGDAVPADIRSWGASAGSRRDLAVDVKGYGGGRLSIVTVVTR